VRTAALDLQTSQGPGSIGKLMLNRGKSSTMSRVVFVGKRCEWSPPFIGLGEACCVPGRDDECRGDNGRTPIGAQANLPFSRRLARPGELREKSCGTIRHYRLKTTASGRGRGFRLCPFPTEDKTSARENRLSFREGPLGLEGEPYASMAKPVPM